MISKDAICLPTDRQARYKIPASAPLWRGKQDTNKSQIKIFKFQTKKPKVFYFLIILI
jgi:hypothetical protein